IICPTPSSLLFPTRRSSDLTVPSGATISGGGSFYGVINLASAVEVNGGSVVPGQLDLPRTITFGNLNLNNASLTYDLDALTTAEIGRASCRESVEHAVVADV